MFLKGAKLLSFRLLILLQNALFWCFGFLRSKKQCGNSLPGTQSYKNVGRWFGVKYCLCCFLCTQDWEWPHWPGKFTWVAFLTGYIHPVLSPSVSAVQLSESSDLPYITGSFSPQRKMASGTEWGGLSHSSDYPSIPPRKPSWGSPPPQKKEVKLICTVTIFIAPWAEGSCFPPFR